MRLLKLSADLHEIHLAARHHDSGHHLLLGPFALLTTQINSTLLLS